VIENSVQIMGGQPFEKEATYKVCTIAYIAKNGGDGFAFFKDPIKAKIVSDEDCEVTFLQ
jgi:hypothetical protein